ncbi:MAG: PBP1A family penicillin-binding protein [Thermoanaerobaculia bacterium]
MAKKRVIRDFVWRHAVGIALIVMAIFVAGIGAVAYNYVVITKKFDSSRRWDVPSRIYSDATAILPGLTYRRSLLEPKLNQVGYHEVESEPSTPGEYRYTDDGLEIYLNNFRYPDMDFQGLPIRISLHRDRVEKITRIQDGVTLRAVRIEPELITSIYDDVMEDRVPIALSAVPQNLINAVLAGEDRNFFEHEGISIRGIVRAALTNLRSGGVKAGGSTITQQLVKNLFLTQKRDFSRKAREALMALILEARYSKKEILEAYLNEIYLGQNGSVQVLGVERAAQVYFGKHAKYLTLPEAATIAGIIPYPNGYSPFTHPDRALKRRNLVLGEMHDLNMIDDAGYRRAIAAPMKVNRFHKAIRSAPYFVDLVMKQLRETYPDTQLETDGLRIFTTLDTMMQRSAEDALSDGIANLKKRYSFIRKKKDPLQGVVLTIQPGTGYVKALVGGTDYQRSQFNRAFQARRQPGSLFKPFVYAAAMNPTEGANTLTPSSFLDDSPISVKIGNQVWEPQNYDNRYHGRVSVRQALAHSYNIPAVRAAIDAGVPNVVQMASKAGVQSRLEPYPSIALGAFEVTPLEIAYAYSVFANEGVKAEPVSILAVATREGKLLENREVRMKRVARAAVTYVVNNILQDVLDYGTAAHIRALGFDRPYAGKTGTTNSYRDAWFVGYSPRLLSLVWVGYDDGENLRLAGASAAMPIWADHMDRIVGMVPEADFRRPDDVVERQIDPESGMLATPYCPETRSEVYVAGTEPTRSCDLHSAWEPYPWLSGMRPDQQPGGAIGGEPDVRTPGARQAEDAPPRADQPNPEKKKKKRGLQRLIDWLFKDDGGR